MHFVLYTEIRHTFRFSLVLSQLECKTHFGLCTQLSAKIVVIEGQLQMELLHIIYSECKNLTTYLFEEMSILLATINLLCIIQAPPFHGALLKRIAQT